MQYNRGTYSPGLLTHKEWNIATTGDPSRGARGPGPILESSCLGILHQEVKPAECLALKPTGAYVQYSNRAIGNRSPLRACHTLSHGMNPTAEALVCMILGQINLLIFAEPSVKVGGS